MEREMPLTGDGFAITLYPAEIGRKGEAYLKVRECAPEAWASALEAGIRRLREMGARRILATGRTPDSPFTGETPTVGGLSFRYVHAVDILEISLAGRVAPSCPRLAGEPLTPENIGEFLELFNTAMRGVPNSCAYTAEDLEELTTCGRRTTLFRLEGACAAAAEVDVAEEPPHINNVAVREDLQGQGLGQELLETLLAGLAEEGYPRAGLAVSTGNPGAYRLYERMGFVKLFSYSAWYELQ